MRVTAVINLKGGVGKTTTVLNMAAILAKDYKARVLLIDADSQCNATEFCMADPEAGNLATLLRAAKAAQEPAELAINAIQPSSVLEGVDVLAGSDELMDLDLTKAGSGDVALDIIRVLAEELAVRDSYDYILIDCPPAFNAASAAALIAADDAVIPIKLDAFALRGMANVRRQIDNMRRINPRLRVSGFLPTMWYRSSQIAAAEATLQDSGLPIYRHIRRSAKVDDTTFAQEALISYSRSSGAAIDYRRFMGQYVEGGAR